MNKLLKVFALSTSIFLLGSCNLNNISPDNPIGPEIPDIVDPNNPDSNNTKPNPDENVNPNPNANDGVIGELKGECPILNMPCTIEIIVKNDYTAFFDFTIHEKIPEGMSDLNKSFDMKGNYEVIEYDYYFTFTRENGQGITTTTENIKAVYAPTSDYTHIGNYDFFTDLGPKNFELTGNLPIK